MVHRPSEYRPTLKARVHQRRPVSGKMIRLRTDGTVIALGPNELVQAHRRACRQPPEPVRRYLRSRVLSGPAASRARSAARRFGRDRPKANTAALPLRRNTNPKAAGIPVSRRTGPAPERYGSCRYRVRPTVTRPGPGRLWPQPARPVGGPSPWNAPRNRGPLDRPVGRGSAGIRSILFVFLIRIAVSVFYPTCLVRC
jgi:hypothetical protein